MIELLDLVLDVASLSLEIGSAETRQIHVSLFLTAPERASANTVEINTHMRMKRLSLARASRFSCAS